MSISDEITILYTTVSSKDEAISIAKKIIEENAAVCINIIDNVSSFYKWNDKIENSNEAIIIIKTLKTTSSNIHELIKKHHSYSVPCIISFDANSHNPEYNRWLLHSNS